MDILAATSAALGGFVLGLLIATFLRRHRRLDVRFEFHAERADTPRREDDRE